MAKEQERGKRKTRRKKVRAKKDIIREQEK